MNLETVDLEGARSYATLLGAAALEVAGDAVIRLGMRGGGVALVVAGFLVLGSYGIVVNRLNIDFSRLFGAYVELFAIASVWSAASPSAIACGQPPGLDSPSWPEP